MAQNSYEHSWFKVKRNISEPIKTMVDNFENKMEKKLRRIWEMQMNDKTD